MRYGWPFYLKAAEAGGFFDIEFFLDDESETQLNTNEFNVFIWPYLPKLATPYEIILDLTNINRANAVRKFVREGGAYIGSCYGAEAASAGFIQPFPFFTLRYATKPELKITTPIISMVISDTLMSIRAFRDQYPIYISTSEITDTSHPLSFGLNKTVKDFFNGPWFVWLGEKSKSLATITQLEPEIDTSHHPLFEKTVIGTPSWVYTQFGKGNVILFSSHPELVQNMSLLFNRFNWQGDSYYGLRIIHNTLHFATSKGLKQISPDVTYGISFVENIGKKTNNLEIVETNDDIFSHLKSRITRLCKNLTEIRDNNRLFNELFTEEFKEDTNLWRNIKYPINYMFEYSDIYFEYCNTTMNRLETLECVYQMLLAYNDTITNNIEELTFDLLRRLNQSEKLVSKVSQQLHDIINLFQSNQIFLHTYALQRDSRIMLNTYQINSKYIPQLNFETEKLLRHFWYTFEAYFANDT